MPLNLPVEGELDWDTKLNAALNALDARLVAAEATIVSHTASLAGKANTVHTHVEADVTNLVTDLAAKAATVHEHDATYEQLANKGIAGGYASLAGDGLVPRAQLASGTASALKYLAGDGTWKDYTGAAEARIVTLSSDATTVSNATTYNSVPGLSSAVLSGDTWYLTAFLHVDGPAPADIDIRLDVPASSTVKGFAQGITTTAGSNTASIRLEPLTDSAKAIQAGTVAVATRSVVLFECQIVAGASGDIGFSFRQGVSDAGVTRIFAGSHYVLSKVST